MTSSTGPGTAPPTSPQQTTAAPGLQIKASPGFAPWLAQQTASLAFTTYKAAKIFAIGVTPDGTKLSVFERSFPRAMGFGHAADGTGRVDTLWLATQHQLWRFQNFLLPGQTQDGYDAVFVPLEARTTGEIDIHDIHPQPDQPDPVFVVTRFNCLATLDHTNSFRPLWTPPFIDTIVPEDRCHLNGLAMRDGRPDVVTCVAAANTAGAWREHRRDGGVVLDVVSGAQIAGGLSMPHSPRWHDGRLYLLQSGTGEFGYLDTDSGQFTPICFLPGFPRGLSFIGSYAVIGLSLPRHDDHFAGLPLEDRLRSAGMAPRCMIAVIDLTTGQIAHRLQMGGMLQEMYDVALLPGVQRPMLIGTQADDIRYMIRPTPGVTL